MKRPISRGLFEGDRSRSNSHATLHILLVCCGLTVPRIDAASRAAQLVKHETFRNFAPVELVGETVSKPAAVGSIEESRVAVLVETSHPEDATRIGFRRAIPFQPDSERRRAGSSAFHGAEQPPLVQWFPAVKARPENPHPLLLADVLRPDTFSTSPRAVRHYPGIFGRVFMAAPTVRSGLSGHSGSLPARPIDVVNIEAAFRHLSQSPSLDFRPGSNPKQPKRNTK